jgi:hypothetical protein
MIESLALMAVVTAQACVYVMARAAHQRLDLMSESILSQHETMVAHRECIEIIKEILVRDTQEEK